MSSDGHKFHPLGHQQSHQPLITSNSNISVLQLDPLLELHLDSSLGYSPLDQNLHTSHLSQQEVLTFHHHHNLHQGAFNDHSTDILNMPAGPSLNAPSPPDSSSPVSMSSSPVPPILMTLGSIRPSEHLQSIRQSVLHVPAICSSNGYSMTPSGHQDMNANVQHQICKSFLSNCTFPIVLTLPMHYKATSFVRITEQPTNRIRYRYKSEKGSHGGLTGESSTQSKKTHPTVKASG